MPDEAVRMVNGGVGMPREPSFYIQISLSDMGVAMEFAAEPSRQSEMRATLARRKGVLRLGPAGQPAKGKQKGGNTGSCLRLLAGRAEVRTRNTPRPKIAPDPPLA